MTNDVNMLSSQDIAFTGADTFYRIRHDHGIIGLWFSASDALEALRSEKLSHLENPRAILVVARTTITEEIVREGPLSNQPAPKFHVVK